MGGRKGKRVGEGDEIGERKTRKTREKRMERMETMETLEMRKRSSGRKFEYFVGFTADLNV